MKKLKQLIKLFDDTYNWRYTDALSKYSIIHIPTLLCFWVSNGRMFFDGYKTTYDYNGVVFETLALRLNVLERIILWSRAKKILKHLDEQIYPTPNALEVLNRYMENSK